MDTWTLDQLKANNPDAHSKALDIIGECGCPEEGDVVAPDEFVVFPNPKGYHMLQWSDYGPFNPVPEWIWDVDNGKWVSNDDEDEEERFTELEEIRHA